MEPPPSDRTDLTWIADVLWGGDGASEPGHERELHVSTDGRIPSGHRVVERYMVLPHARSPRLLVPLGSRRAAAASLRRFDAGITGTARLARRLLAFGTWAGVAPLALRHRLIVSAPRSAPPTSAGVTGHIAAALGRDDLVMALYLGVPRPNRKPVVQVVALDGALIAYAKVGWNELTRGLVRAEAAALGALAADPPSAFAAPQVLHAARLGGREIVIMSPLPSSAIGRGGAIRDLPVDAAREISTRGGAAEAPLLDAPFWETLRTRAEAAGGAASPDVRRRLAAAIEALADHGMNVILSFGAWHGDWAPWNMGRVSGRLFVWDWERSGRPVPVGFDVAHFHHQVLARGARRSAADAVAAMRAASRRDLLAIGVAAEAHDLVTALYLVELFLRYQEATALGGVTPGALSASTLAAAERACASL